MPERVKRPSLAIFTQDFVNLPSLLAKSARRYSIILTVVAMVAIAFNAPVFTQEKMLWFIAGVGVVFAIGCGICVTILDAVAWNFERLRQELGVERHTIDVDAA